MDTQNGIDMALFFLIMGYITLFIKETRSGWTIPSKYILHAATATTFIFSGLIVGFYTIIVYIIVSLIILVLLLPVLRLLLEKRRSR
jgi:uncharacterized membrane protein